MTSLIRHIVNFRPVKLYVIDADTNQYYNPDIKGTHVDFPDITRDGRGRKCFVVRHSPMENVVQRSLELKDVSVHPTERSHQSSSSC